MIEQLTISTNKSKFLHIQYSTHLESEGLLTTVKEELT